MSTKVEIFTFESESHDTFRWTSANDAVSYDSASWQPAAITRGSVKTTVDFDKKSAIKLTFPIDNELVDLFERYPPAHDTLVTISQGLRPLDSNVLTDVEVIATGILSSSGTENEEAYFEVTPALKKANKVGPAGLYSATCRWALYSRGCTIDEADFTISTLEIYESASDESTKTLRIRIPAIVADGFFTGGYIKGTYPVTDPITILSQGTAFPATPATGYKVDIVLAGWNEDLFGAYAAVVPGCDYSFGTCNSRFSNTDNFGGFKELPSITRTPYGTGHSD